MITKEKLCNLALNEIGHTRISAASLESNDIEEAKVLNLVFDSCVDEMALANKDGWNCLRARKQITADSQEPAFGNNYAYTLPDEPYCLRVSGVSLEGVYIDYTVEGRTLYCCSDGEDITLVYTARPKLQSGGFEIPNYLEKVLYLLIAKRITPKVTSSETLLNKLEDMYRTSYLDALFQDASENYVDEFGSRLWGNLNADTAI